MVKAKVDYNLYWLTDIGKWNPKEEEPEENNSATSYGNTQKGATRRAASKNNAANFAPGTIIRDGVSSVGKDFRNRLRGGQK